MSFTGGHRRSSNVTPKSYLEKGNLLMGPTEKIGAGGQFPLPRILVELEAKPVLSKTYKTACPPPRFSDLPPSLAQAEIVWFKGNSTFNWWVLHKPRIYCEIL